MLITNLLPNGYLSVRFTYCQDYIDRIKTVTGAFFNNILKVWMIPVSSFYEYEKVFYDEIVYQTPRWEITGEKPPDYTSLYNIDSSIHSPLMKTKLFGYQDYGIRFMLDRLRHNKFVLNTDDMGLGKTIQTIGVFQYLMQYCGLKRVLIVCKKTIKSQWCSEIDKFTNICNKMLVDYTGTTKKKRIDLYEKAGKQNMWVLATNYNICLNDTEYIENLNPQLVIIDEAHVLRNHKSKTNKAVKKICKKATSVIFLTGTPIQTRPEDLFGIINIADSNFFGSWDKFRKRYIKYDNKGRYETQVGVMHLSELKNKIQQYFIRRTVQEVNMQIPDMIEKKIYCPVDGTQTKIMEIIKENKNKIQTQLNSLYSRRNFPDIRIKYEQLEGMAKGLLACEQEVANDPRLFRVSDSDYVRKTYSPYISDKYQMSSKLETLIDIVDTILGNNEKVIIFSKFSKCVNLIKKTLEEQFSIKVNTVVGGGEMSDDAKELNIKEFKESFDVNVLVATHTLAEGVNLQVARHQVNFDQPDSDAIKSQMAGRVRRVGSKYKNVFIYDLLTENSKDIERYENIQRLKALSSGIVGIDKAQSEYLKNINSGANGK